LPAFVVVAFMIYVDISDLMSFCRERTHVTGIQRVSMQTLAKLVDLAGPSGFKLVARHVEMPRILATGTEFFQSGPSDAARFCSHFNVVHLPAIGKTKAGEAFPAQAVRIMRLLRVWLDCQWKIAASGWRSSGPGWQRPIFGSNDVLYFPGGIWAFEGYVRKLERIHAETGVRIVVFVHDLIPLVMPHLVEDPRLADRFERWLRRMSAISACFLTCSQSTRRDLEGFFVRSGIRPLPVEVVPHAHEFVGFPRSGAGAPAKEGERGYVLCVGTLEARKNNLVLAKAWANLLARHGRGLPRLVFAGKQGWLNEDFKAFLMREKRLSGHVTIIESPTDDVLASLYRNCLFSVYPSLYEGWGLPIGESLWFGRPVIASRASAMPEVAAHYVDYVDPLDIGGLEAAVERLLDPDRLASRTAMIAGMPMRTWEHAATDIWAALQRISRAS